MPANIKALVALLVPLLLIGCSPDQPPPLEGSSIRADFALVDAAGQGVTNADFPGQYLLVYFGYTYCPDVCPFDMQRMMRGFDSFAAEQPDLAARVQPIFITIDPERDTADVVGEYTAAFSDRLIGLTGTPEQVRAAADSFAVYYAQEEPDADGNYLMQHTNIAYLMDPEGNPLAPVPVDHSAEAVAAELARWVR